MEEDSDVSVDGLMMTSLTATTEQSVRNHRRRRKRGLKKKKPISSSTMNGFSIISEQLMSGSVSSIQDSPEQHFDDHQFICNEDHRKMSCLELEDLEDSISTTAFGVELSPPGITPAASIVSSQSMWEVGSYQEEEEMCESRPIIRSPMMMEAVATEVDKVDEIVAGIESVLGKINTLVGTTQITRLCIPSTIEGDSSIRRDSTSCVPRPKGGEGFLVMLEEVRKTVSGSIEDVLEKIRPPEHIDKLISGLKTMKQRNTNNEGVANQGLSSSEMVEIPVLNRRQRRSILFGGRGDGKH